MFDSHTNSDFDKGEMQYYRNLLCSRPVGSIVGIDVAMLGFTSYPGLPA
jgi:hypothetical protein